MLRIGEDVARAVESLRRSDEVSMDALVAFVQASLDYQRCLNDELPLNYVQVGQGKALASTEFLMLLRGPSE